MTDLVVLVPDADIEQTVRGLLARGRSLGSRTVSFTVVRHLMRDSGCRDGAAEVLRSQRGGHRFALVIFDRHGCGSDDARDSIQREVEQNLVRTGWERQCCRAIVIEPELEAWLWNGSVHVARALGWSRYAELQRHLRRAGLWPADAPKPPDPKQALKTALRAAPTRRGRWNQQDFLQLARETSLRRCVDQAFLELTSTIRRWFPLDPR